MMPGILSKYKMPNANYSDKSQFKGELHLKLKLPN